jgi:RNA polymerase sigma-70 factor (ECF subfamily)
MTGSGSFEEFYTGTVGRLLGALFLVTGDLHEAEEVVQEAFARASLHWTRLRDLPEAWVRRVAMNLATDRARTLQRQGGSTDRSPRSASPARPAPWRSASTTSARSPAPTTIPMPRPARNPPRRRRWAG